MFLLYQTLNTQHLDLVRKGQILTFALGLPFLLFYDSSAFNEIMPYGQWICNYFAIWVYLWIYCFANQRIRKLMIITTLVGLGMEIGGSVILKLYTYRLERVPFYVPFGHSILFVIATLIRKQNIVIQYSVQLSKLLFTLTLLLCLFSLFVLNDIAGAAFYLIFLALLRSSQHKLSHLISFFTCYYVELIGTQMHVWTWYSTFGNHPTWPHIANPPCGIGGAYVALHLTSANIYYFLRRFRRQRITPREWLQRLDPRFRGQIKRD